MGEDAGNEGCRGFASLREWYSTLAEEGHGRVEQEGLEGVQRDARDGWDQWSVESEFAGREPEQNKDEDKKVAIEIEGRKKAMKRMKRSRGGQGQRVS